MRTSRAVALAAALVIVAGVAGSYVVVHRHHGGAAPQADTPSAPLPSSPAPREPVLASLDPSAAAPQPGSVRDQLRRIAGNTSQTAHLVGEVVDAKSGDVLWALHPTRAAPPASTTKLLTAAAALHVLGPDYRLRTTTRRVGNVVYLVGGGDPTIVRNSASYVSPKYPQPATMAELARRTARALADHKRVRLKLDATGWSGPRSAPGWKPTYVTEGDITPPASLELDEGRTNPQSPEAARTQDPVGQAGAAFAALLEHDGIDVVGRPTLGAPHARGWVQMASVESPTVAALVSRMLTVSDDDLAEALGRAVAQHEHLPASFAGAGRAVTKAVASLGVPARGVVLRDTSGLSHDDRVTPRALVTLLRVVAAPGRVRLRPLLAGLPVGGLTGTLSGRFLTGSTSTAAGVVRAKTGTLTGVNALSGVLVDHGGRLLVFAFLASHARLPGLTVPDLDRLAAALSRCGCGG